MPRERMRDLELPAYMRALVEAREKWMDESSGRLNEHIEHLEWIDELAVALGISVDAEDWWDSTVPAKRTKIMGRISVLRSLRPAPETSPVQAVCDRAAHLADVPTPRMTETAVAHVHEFTVDALGAPAKCWCGVFARDVPNR